MDGDLVRGLLSRKIDVVTAHTDSMINRTDDEHLEHAAKLGCDLYSYDVRDFFDLHTAWLHASRSHSGIILTRQKRYTVGEQIRKIVRLSSERSAEGMRDRIEFLGSW